MKKNKQSSKRKILLKVDPTVLAEFRGMAKRYTNGNVSAWIRFAAAKLHPRGEARKLLPK
jgi:hypothetical protein